MTDPRAPSSTAYNLPRTALTGILITGDQSKLSDIEKESLWKLITQLNEVPDNNPKDIHFTFMNFYLLEGYIPQKSRQKALFGHIPVKGNLLQYLDDTVEKFNKLTQHTMFNAVPKAGKNDSHLENILFGSIKPSNPFCSYWNLIAIIKNLFNKTFDNLRYKNQNEFVNCIKALVRMGILEDGDVNDVRDVWDEMVENSKLKDELNIEPEKLESMHLKNLSETGKKLSENDIVKLYENLIPIGVANNQPDREMQGESVVKIHLGGRKE